MKVLFISSLYHPHVGGVETMIKEMAEHYRKRGIEPVVLTKKWPNTLEIADTYQGTGIYRIVSAKTHEGFSGNIEWIKKNELLIRADLIHVIGIRRPLPLIAFLLSKWWNVPLVYTVAGGDIPHGEDQQTKAIWEEGKETVHPVIEAADYITCVSEYLTTEVRMLFPEIDRIATLYAGINCNRISETAPEKYCTEYILSLRRLDPSKGVDALIKAFNLIAGRYPHLRLLVAGDGTEKENLTTLAKSLSLDKRVDFIGTVPHNRGIALLKGARMTVVPSISEGGGLVNVEAQAAGCPVIASRVDGIPEYLSDGVGGILFEPGNLTELAQKMDLLMSDEGLRNELATNGSIFAKKFDWNNHLIPQYLNIYSSVVNNHHKNNINLTNKSDLIRHLWTQLNGKTIC